jgi:hypothetical protein
MNQLFGLGEEEKLGEADRMVLLRISRDKMAARRDRRTVRSGARICRPFRSPGIDSQHGGPVRQPYLSYWPASLHGWRNRFLGTDSWAP